MNKKIMILLYFIIFLCLTFSLVPKAHGEEEAIFHDYHYEKAVIRISNLKCITPNVDSNIFPYMVMAHRIDGQVLLGCYKKENGSAVIFWQTGDVIPFELNLFKLIDVKMENLNNTKT